MTIKEFFRNMAVLGPQKTRRIAIAEDWENFLTDWLMMQEQDLKEGLYIENQNIRTEQFVREYARVADIDRATATRLIDEMGSTIAQNGSDAARRMIGDNSITRKEKSDREVILKAYKSAEAIRNTNSNELFNIPMQTTGYEDAPARILMGLPIAAVALVGAKKLFDRERADRIAVNEANWLCNHEEHEERVTSGAATHTWITCRDERVRDAHMMVDGQTVGINEPFIVSGYRMYYPGDISDNPPADLIIGCRCSEA